MASQEGTNPDQMVDAGIDLREATTSAEQFLSQDPQLAQFLELFRKLHTEGLLNGPDLVTVFAPQSVEELMGKSDDELDSALRSHLLGRAVTLDELRTTTAVKTLENTELRIERRGKDTFVNGVRIIRPDVPCTNGVVHVVEHAVT
jgi:uncharacterized surface protein with fasciclin (FAS1) repeats